MNILKLFTREAKVEATTDDVLDDLRAEETRKREQAGRERQQTAEYRAKITAEANDRLARAYNTLDELADLIPRLRLACGDLNRIVEEINVKGLGYEHGGLIEDTLGVPVDFASKMLAAITDAAPNTEWDYGHIGSLGKGVKAERPKLRGAQEMRVPTFAGDAARTYNVSLGQYPPERPVDGQGTSVMFLPPAP